METDLLKNHWGKDNPLLARQNNFGENQTDLARIIYETRTLLIIIGTLLISGIIATSLFVTLTFGQTINAIYEIADKNNDQIENGTKCLKDFNDAIKVTFRWHKALLILGIICIIFLGLSIYFKGIVLYKLTDIFILLIVILSIILWIMIAYPLFNVKPITRMLDMQIAHLEEKIKKNT